MDDTLMAFPHVNPNYDGNWDKEPQRSGMTLRDWFAGQALISTVAMAGSASRLRGLSDNELAEWAARVAYTTADALLAARDAK